MPIVLVVDDSPVDQQLVGGLLKRDFDWIVEYANDGTTAVEMMGDIFPDLVITDLQMPNMDGIELCRIARKKFPQVPVILTTGQGSEALAIEALNAGATSYVPKSALAESLNDTVDQILEYSRRDRSMERLIGCTTNCRHQFKIDSDPSLIPPLLDYLRDSMTSLKLGDATTIRHASVALEEALANALYHGNLELSVDQTRQARHLFLRGSIHDLIKSRLREQPYSTRKIIVAIDLSKTKAQFIVRDQGDGFNHSALPDISDVGNLSDMKDRGLTLIRNFMSEVAFNDEGNEIRMTLNVAKAEPATA